MLNQGGVNMYRGVKSAQPPIDIEAYAPLVKRIAYHLLAKLPSSVQLDDLIQSGMLGLLEAASKFDASKGASFDTYASIRIRGSMVDEIRKGDWTPRSVHRNAREITSTINHLSGLLGRDPNDIEIAEAMSISVDQYHAMARDAQVGQLASLEESFIDNEIYTDAEYGNSLSKPHEESSKAAFKKALTEAIASLPEREKLVIALYYDEELNLKEIGEVIGVSESRVSQIHSQASMRLRSKLEQW